MDDKTMVVRAERPDIDPDKDVQITRNIRYSAWRNGPYHSRDS